MKKLFVDIPLAFEITIPPADAHHILHVLRHDREDPLLITGKEGKTGQYLLTQVTEETCVAMLQQWVDTEEETSDIRLVQAYLKGDKFEWILQKATELNVSHIYGVPLRHCVATYDSKKLDNKTKRWQTILKESAQQCGRQVLPTLVTAASWSEVLAATPNALHIFAYEGESKQTLKEVLQKTDKRRPICLWVGPEGGFHPEEVKGLLAAGAQSATLGKTILRAETAAISAIAMTNYEVNM